MVARAGVTVWGPGFGSVCSAVALGCLREHGERGSPVRVVLSPQQDLQQLILLYTGYRSSS